MDELPELALTELFNALPLHDQLKIRGVCKRWKAIIESSLSDRVELVIFYRSITRPLVWFHSDRPVDLLCSVIVNEKFKKNPLFERLFKRIKRLYLICRLRDLSKSNFINFVNRFRHLEHLQMDTLADPVRSTFPHQLKIRFNLPNLKSFCYNTKAGRTKLLQLDCPKLEKLSVPYDFRLDEKCASFRESLKFLRVASFECEQGFELPNLEVLYCQTIFPLIDISAHKKLKEIHYYWEHPNYAGNHIDDETRTVLNGLFEQKRRLERSSLEIYYGNIRCVLEPGGVIIRRAELPRDLKLGHQRKDLYYKSELDEEIAALNAEQVEKLARCLEEVVFTDTLNRELALNAKFKILFRFVQKLRLWKGNETQDDLDKLPDLFPHVVELKQAYAISVCNRVRNPSAYPDEFGGSPLNFHFIARFKALHKLNSENWRISLNELKEILASCRFLEEAHLYSAKLEELENGQIRVRLATIGILLDNQFKTGAYEYEYSVNYGKETEKIREQRIPLETFHSAEAMMVSLDQKGYLRDEIGQP